LVSLNGWLVRLCTLPPELIQKHPHRKQFKTRFLIMGYYGRIASIHSIIRWRPICRSVKTETNNQIPIPTARRHKKRTCQILERLFKYLLSTMNTKILFALTISCWTAWADYNAYFSPSFNQIDRSKACAVVVKAGFRPTNSKPFHAVA
jgi:hypothetical protein